MKSTTTPEVQAKLDRYFRFIEWSDEDQVFIGRAPDLMGGGVHAETRSECEEALRLAMEDVGEDYEERHQWPEITLANVYEKLVPAVA